MRQSHRAFETRCCAFAEGWAHRVGCIPDQHDSA
jgi:hypothetical protein